MTMPLVGYRAWRVVDGSLHSVFAQATWPVGERMTARCRPPEYLPRHGPPPRHDAPDQYHGCGIYARTTLAGAISEYAHQQHTRYPTCDDALLGEQLFLGVVLLYGRTFHGGLRPTTIRAEFAQPLCLMGEAAWARRGSDWFRKLDRVAARYGLPIIPRAGIERYAAEYGEQIGTRDTDPMHAEPRWRAWWPFG